MFTQILTYIILLCAPIITSHSTVYAIEPIVSNVTLQQQVGYKPYRKILNEKEVKCLTDNIYFEARGEKDIGKKAIAFVTLNRLNDEDYPKTICKIVYQKIKYKCQFTWACKRKTKIYDALAYSKCNKIANHVMMNYTIMPDITKGSTNFHRRDIQPTWANQHKKTIAIGKHVFYKL